MIRKWLIKKLRLIFNDELQELNKTIQNSKKTNETLNRLSEVFVDLLNNIDVSVDVHQCHRYSNSWAVVSLQGTKVDYIKFIDLGDRDIREIASFLRKYERICNVKIDAHPETTPYLRVINRKYKF